MHPRIVLPPHCSVATSARAFALLQRHSSPHGGSHSRPSHSANAPRALSTQRRPSLPQLPRPQLLLIFLNLITRMMLSQNGKPSGLSRKRWKQLPNLLPHPLLHLATTAPLIPRLPLVSSPRPNHRSMPSACFPTHPAHCISVMFVSIP